MPGATRPPLRARRLLASGALVLAFVASLACAPSLRAAPATAVVVVKVSGLPQGAKADLRVSGAARAKVRATRSLTARPGRLVVAVRPVRTAKGQWSSARPRVVVRVRAGRRTIVPVRYTTFVPRTTKPISAAVLASRARVDGNSITLPSAIARRYRPGDVIVAGVGAATPEGLLRTVVSTTPADGGATTLATRQADLSDAVPRGELRVVQTPGQRPGSLSAHALPSATLDLNRTFLSANASLGSCSARADLVGRGQISVSPSFDLKASWGLRGNRVEFSAGLTETASAGLAASLSGQCDYAHESPRITFAPITVFVGPVPVVITPQLSGVLSLSAGGELKADATVRQTFEISGGLAVSGGTVTPLSSVTTRVTADPPLIEPLAGGATIKAGPTLALRVYGITGANIGATAETNLGVNAGQSPWWRLDGGVNVNVGVDFLGLKASREVYSRRFEIAKADGPPGPSSEEVLLGAADFVPYGEGWGTPHPARIFNGGAPSGLAYDITWTSWGAADAYGRGLIALYMPGGGYYAQPGLIELHAYGIGSCDGTKRQYLRLEARQAEYPGGPLGPWFKWAGQDSLCKYG